jgi:membrane-bound serine protease (ClpP class)
MSRAIRLGCATLCLVGAMFGALARPAGAQSSPASTVLRLDLNGVVDPFVADYLKRGIDDAAAQGDAAVLIVIDTPGGLDSSMREITQAVSTAGVPVIGYVAPTGARAASAGAFVLMSCPVAAMAPGTNVGAATPVGLNGATGSEKAVNDAAALMRSLAEAQGRNADVASSFVTDAASLSAEQALQEDVIDLIAPMESELLSAVDGTQVHLADGTTVALHTADAQVVDQAMGGFLGFLHRLFDPNLAFIFFWLGLGLIVLEVIVPGHILSGTVGAILMLLAIVSFGLLPVRFLGIGLLIVSAVAFAAEAAHPGLGVWGIIGLVALVLGGWFLYDRADGDGVSVAVIIPVAILVALFFGLVVTKARKLRDMPPPPGPEAIVGREGVAMRSGLSPSGVVRIDAEEWRAVSGAGTIPGGARVRVTGIDGFVLTVEPATLENEPVATTPPAQGGGTT